MTGKPLPPGALDRLLDLARPLLDEPDRPVDFLGKYELVRELGRGATGVVYEATAAYGGSRRKVAIKMIGDGRFAGASLRRRLWNEALTATRLTHPNIVRILEVHSAYLVLQFVDGPSLAAAGRPFDRRRAVALVADAARAVDYAHGQGLLHLDLKPANLLVSASTGKVYVTDFGLARRDLEGTDRSIVGTPAYMAPEQAAGTAVGPTTDVYGLAAALYDLLAGRPPVAGSLEAVRAGRVDPLAEVAPDLDPDLADLVMTALAPDPADRPPTAAALAEGLDRARRPLRGP